MIWQDESDSLKAIYDKDGFVSVRPFLNEEDTSGLRQELDRYVREVVPNVPPMDAFFDDPEAKAGLRMLPRMHEHDDFFARMLYEGPCQELATLLLGAEAVPRDAAFFNKLPLKGDATPPHQDGYYFHLHPCEALTLWLALDDVDEENGCIRYVAGSHRRGMRHHGRTEVLGFSQGIVDYGIDDDVAGELAVSARPGDLLAHHALTIHRADANRSHRPRRAMGFIYYSIEAKLDDEARKAYQAKLEAELSAKGKIS